MPRQKREDLPGAWHHVMHRGARRAPIFAVPSDCVGFLDLVAEMVSRHGIEVHACSPMPPSNGASHPGNPPGTPEMVINQLDTLRVFMGTGPLARPVVTMDTALATALRHLQ